MVIYLAIFSLFAFVGLLVNKPYHQLLIGIFICFALMIFMGGRFQVGCDFSSYLNRFNNLYWEQDYFYFLKVEEPGFHLLNIIINKLGLDYVWLNVLASTIYLMCLFRFSRLSPNLLLFITLCFPILIVQLGMSGIRQALALGFLMLAYASFVDKQKNITFLWILLAGQFHQSAYLFLPLAFLAGRQFKLYKVIIALILIGPLSAFFLEDRTQVYSARYVEQIYGENSSNGAWIRYGLVFFSAILFEFFRKRVKRIFVRSYELMRLFSLITFALLPIGFISTVALHRLIYFVMPVCILMLISVFMIIPVKQGVTKKLMATPVIIFGAYLVFWFVFSGHASSCYVPYKSYFL